jgi:hypothetical protein
MIETRKEDKLEILKHGRADRFDCELFQARGVPSMISR